MLFFPSKRDLLWTWTQTSDNDCCKWRGVSCNNQSRVTGLYLLGGDLEGKISPSLLNLTYLNYLDLSENSFGGTIPLELGNLANLETLNLGRLTNSTIESLDWLSHLSKLKVLYMEGTSLAKVNNWVNVILSLQNLGNLNFDNCNLSHVMHPYDNSVFSSSFTSSIAQLYLRNNNLNSSMYHWLFPLTSNRLAHLDLSGNKLEMIPTYIGDLCNLTGFYFQENSIAIKFSDFLRNLSGCASLTLQELDALSSGFTGSLSDDIQSFSSLVYLQLSNNQLNGTISEKVWELPNLSTLYLSSNSLKGEISRYIGNSYIQKMDLSNNSLEGIPSKAGMSNLSSTVIELSFNNFYGPIPNVSSTVVRLDLSKNKFYGRITFLCQIVNGSLILLDLSENSLSGEIPDCFWHFKNLRFLKLGQNNLTGRLPASMKYLIKLEVLYLYNNSFFGEFPVTLKNCIRLTQLDMGDNMFSGYVPIWIGEKLSSLYALSLTSNSFTGTIPLELCQLASLTVLDLSMNNLYGTIPSCLNNLTSMVQGGFSSPQNMHFSRDIFKKATDARFVDHAIIKWHGSLRDFSNNLGLVKFIDLSSNNLIGNIPHELTHLHELISLNLSMNALVGEIPREISEMKKLQILDLSRNSLSGRIPSNMSQMASLDYLDVSSNNLSGRIPSSTQLQSFERSRYSGNEGLCGPPLTKYCPGDKREEVPSVIGQSEGQSEGEEDIQRWFYIGLATGFAIGFWIVCGVLLLYRRGRHAFFWFMNSLESWVYVKVMVFFAKWQRVAQA